MRLGDRRITRGLSLQENLGPERVGNSGEYLGKGLERVGGPWQ